MELLALELAVEVAIAREVAQVEERGARGVVLARRAASQAREVAHAVADLELQVPERVEEPLARGLHERVRLARAVQDEEVDVAVGRELPPAVAAERDERRPATARGPSPPRRRARSQSIATIAVHRGALEAHDGVAARAGPVDLLHVPARGGEVRLRVARERRAGRGSFDSNS